MAGATFKTQNQAPRVTPDPFFTSQPADSLGDPDKNFPENHPTFATTESPEVNSYQEAQPHGGSLTRNKAPEVMSVTRTSDGRSSLVLDVPHVLKKGEYHPGYAEEMLRFFDKPKVEKIYETYTWKSGAVTEKVREVPATPPHFSEFARKIGVTTRQLKKWARDHEDFREAYETCQEIFEEFLIDNGLTGSYGAIAMKFVAVNRTKMKDKVVTENVTLDINKVLDSIAAGNVKPGGQLDMPQEDI